MPALKFQDFKDAMDQCLSEALSTCLIVFFSGLIRMTSPDSFIAGGVVFFLYSFLIYGNYKFSKSHFNPAVTIAYYLHDDLSMLSAIMLVICQLVGSVGAALLLALMELLGVNKQKHMFLGCPWLGTFTYNGKLIQSTTMFQLWVIEIIGGFFLMYFVMKSLWDKRVPENIYGFIIGGYYAANQLAFDKVTGGPINPARVFGPALFSLNFIHIFTFIAYLIAPVVGCYLGGHFYLLGNLDSNKKVILFESKEFVLNRPDEFEINL